MLPPSSPTGPAALAEGLLETLAGETGALGRLRDGFGAQLEAIGRRDHGALDAATVATNDVVAELERLRTGRERQIRLLGKVLRLPSGETTVADLAAALAATDAPLAARLVATRDHLRTIAAEARVACEEVEFALGYAAELSRELMQTLQQHGVSAPTRVYTARGATASTTPTRSYLNELG